MENGKIFGYPVIGSTPNGPLKIKNFLALKLEKFDER